MAREDHEDLKSSHVEINGNKLDNPLWNVLPPPTTSWAAKWAANTSPVTYFGPVNNGAFGAAVTGNANVINVQVGSTNNAIGMIFEQKTPTQDQIRYKYSEDRIISDLKKYVDKTYSAHYSTDEDIQAIDAWIAMGDATPTFRNTAIKYLWRYGKKNGNNKDDLMKALHYIIFALHNDHYKGK